MFFVFFAVTTISRKTLNNSNHISSSTFQFTLSKLLIGRIKDGPQNQNPGQKDEPKHEDENHNGSK